MNTHKEFRQAWQRLALVLLALAGVVACQTPDEDEIIYPPATTILRVELTPDTLIEGDTLTIKCVVTDSLDPSIKFDWLIGKDYIIPVNNRLDSSVIKWHANQTNFFLNVPDSINIYYGAGGVRVSKTNSSQYASFAKYFTIILKRRVED